MWLVDWLIARWQRVNEVFETWYWRIRDAFENHWAEFWYVVVVWYGQAYRYFREKVNQLEDVVVGWYGRIRGAIYDNWGILWQALTASWSYIWDHFYQGYKSIIDYTYSARADIQDTFTRFKYEFQAFRINPSQYIRDKIVERWPNFELFFADPSTYIKNKIIERWPNFEAIITDPVEYIVLKIGWVRSKWDWFWRNPFGFIIAQVGGNTWWWELFVANPLSYINLYIYGYLRAEYPALFTIYVWLTTKWDAFTKEVGKFLANPYLYITRLLQAWIEGWRDYILGVVASLFDDFNWDIIDGIVRFIVNLFPRHASSPPEPEEYTDFDSLIEDSLYWLEGDGAKQLYGYDDLVVWTAEEVFLEKKPLPHGL